MSAAHLAPVVFVTGKGGVGKTTIAAALALDAVRHGRRAALVEFGDGEAGLRALGTSRPDVDHLVVGFDESLADMVADLLGSRTLAKVFVGHSAMRRLIRAAPGIAELVKLDAVRRLEENGPRGRRIVVDLPASGHAVGWLRVASAIARFARVGPFHEMARRVDEMVRDPRRASIVVVTLAEPLVLRETAELCRTLTAEMSRAPELVAINRVPFEDGLGVVESVRELSSSIPAAIDLEKLLDARRAARKEARAALGEAGSLGIPHYLEVPEAPTDPEPHELIAWMHGAVAP